MLSVSVYCPQGLLFTGPPKIDVCASRATVRAPCADRQIGSQFWSRKISNLRAERFRTENFRTRAWRVILGVVTVRFSDKLNIHFVNDRSCVVLRHDSIHESSVRLDLRATLHCRSYLVTLLSRIPLRFLANVR